MIGSNHCWNFWLFYSLELSIPKLGSDNILCNSVLLKNSHCLINRTIFYWTCDGISSCFQTSPIHQITMVLYGGVKAHFPGLYQDMCCLLLACEKWTNEPSLSHYVFIFILVLISPALPNFLLTLSFSPFIFTIYFRIWLFYFKWTKSFLWIVLSKWKSSWVINKELCLQNE